VAAVPGVLPADLVGGSWHAPPAPSCRDIKPPTMIAKILRTYRTNFLRQEKGLRDHEMTESWMVSA
jgi:hypothetical protein